MSNNEKKTSTREKVESGHKKASTIVSIATAIVGAIGAVLSATSKK